jgi:hypothetical protein
VEQDKKMNTSDLPDFKLWNENINEENYGPQYKEHMSLLHRALQDDVKIDKS